MGIPYAGDRGARAQPPSPHPIIAEVGRRAPPRGKRTTGTTRGPGATAACAREGGEVVFRKMSLARLRKAVEWLKKHFVELQRSGLATKGWTVAT